MKIGGLVEQLNLTMYLIKLEDVPGAAADILILFGKKKINLSYITETTSADHKAALALCVDREDEERVDALIKDRIEKKSDSIKKQENVAIVGVYGPHFREKPAIAANFCHLLGESCINILGISSSISTISCVINAQEFDKAKNALFSHFELP